MRNSIGTSSSLMVSQRLTKTVLVADAAEQQTERNQKRQARSPARPEVGKLAHPLRPQTAIAAPRSGKNGTSQAKPEEKSESPILDQVDPRQKLNRTRFRREPARPPLDPRLNRMRRLDARGAEVRV